MLSSRRTRQGLVIAIVLSLLLGSIASWAWSGRIRRAKQQEREELSLFLEASSAGWAKVTDQFFNVPEATAQAIGALSDDLDSHDELLVLLGESIRPLSALDAAFIGYPDGSFVFVARSDELVEGGFRTRVISFDDGERTVELTWTDAEMSTLERHVDDQDDYDPRERPWYLSAGAERYHGWTAPYVFASSQQPGITYSRLLVDDTGAPRGVVGIDIRLTDLSEFLELLAPGKRGEAMVIDASGELIASASRVQAGSPSILPVLSDDRRVELGSIIAELVATEAPFVLQRSNDGTRTTVARPVRTSSEWYLAVEAFDQDFVGEFSRSRARNVFGIVAVGTATAIIVGAVSLLVVRRWGVLKDEAEFDELTGVLSRRAFKREAQNRIEAGEPVSLGIIDLDRFKRINDTFGHPEGDRVLAAVAAKLEGYATQHGGRTGRLGGDEFALLVAPEFDWSALCTVLNDPVRIGDAAHDIGASIGVAGIGAADFPGSPATLEELLHDADRALFEVKRGGGGAVKRYSPAAQSPAPT